ncbi:vaccinia B20R-like protein [Fowlpox virus]|uniref:ORF FPV225 vaccinia B20R homolog n=2 Tax=Fowlpox virus TaxID=10261 RepID=Q9J510_FOWPN|nr:vaccinia B20R homolog [Fowlpox virus]UNS14464.1 ALPV-300 [Albatrosspox virus]WPD91035.1 B20-like hypothetical protein [Avipoxvirus sp.]CAE52760.1 hypothetical B20R-like protein [Fowlpox virus isolate HP-438/Munich]AAF44569.1 ORF FPV225 vaccinia B20R homolog [Fowlpox virus]ART91658.1 hypothetical B20R-like protein [Fowlpox virus]
MKYVNFINAYSVYDIYINKNKIDINIPLHINYDLKYKEIKNEFPIYRDMIEKKIRYILDKPNLVYKVINCMSEYMDSTYWMFLPTEIKFKVLSYLSSKDLYFII